MGSESQMAFWLYLCQAWKWILLYIGLETMHINLFLLAYNKYLNIPFLSFASIVTLKNVD